MDKESVDFFKLRINLLVSLLDIGVEQLRACGESMTPYELRCMSDGIANVAKTLDLLAEYKTMSN